MHNSHLYIESALVALGYETLVDDTYYHEDHETTVILSEDITKSLVVAGQGPQLLTKTEFASTLYCLGEFIIENRLNLDDDDAFQAQSAIIKLNRISGREITWE